MNDVADLGGGGIWQKVMLLHKPIFSKIDDKGKGGVKNLMKYRHHLWIAPKLNHYIFSKQKKRYIFLNNFQK